LLNHWEEDVAATATILAVTVAAPPTGNIYIYNINKHNNISVLI
jgi:hypothetical protein